MLKLILIVITNIKFIYTREENINQIIKELCIEVTTFSDTNLI